ncbi:MAG: helix-turn-helix domain-containing protein [Polyangiales bacterium]
MESIGTWLRREREVRGVSLEEVADATRIPVQSLSSLEEGRFEELPGEVFVKGFLRSYARAVGLAGDEVLARYSIEVRSRDVRPLAVRPSIPSQDRGRRFGLAIALVVFGILATLAISFLLRPRTQDGPEVLSALPAATVAPVG